MLHKKYSGKFMEDGVAIRTQVLGLEVWLLFSEDL